MCQKKLSNKFPLSHVTSELLALKPGFNFCHSINRRTSLVFLVQILLFTPVLFAGASDAEGFYPKVQSGQTSKATKPAQSETEEKINNDDDYVEHSNDLDEKEDEGDKKGDSIFSGSTLSGGGGGFYVLGGFGSDLGSSLIMGARGFATISKSYRLGGYGQVAGFLSNDDGIGHGGLYLSNFFHFDSISIGVGANGGFGVLASDKNLKDSKQIIVVQPHLELEWPLHDFCTVTAILGNQFVLSQFNDPGLNQVFMGFSLNFGHFTRQINTKAPPPRRR